MIIKQGATTPLLYPCTDSAGLNLDLTTLTRVCFRLSGPAVITKEPGDPGHEIVNYSGGVNNALLITLSPPETQTLRPGRLYKYWVWGDGVDGEDILAFGEATVIYTEKC